ncbi:outer membrane protein assembly factor BamD [bacterium]|nr:outer membrane protein assembly factor BamD [bacterium]
MRLNIIRTYIIASLLAVLIFAVGCGKGKRAEQLPADVAWKKIMDHYNDGKYLDAVDRLEIFLINYSGSALADSAQYILAESHFEMKEYITAAAEYERTVVQYPQSHLAESALYKLGESFYKLSPKFSLDQTYTNKAINGFQLFIEDFPTSDRVEDAQDKIFELRQKLARKEFRNGRLYSIMKEPTAARIYYQLVMDNYYDTEYAALSQFYIAKTYEQQEDWVAAIEEFNKFLEKYGDHEKSSDALSGLNSAIEESKKPMKQKDTDQDDSIEEFFGSEGN